MPVYEYACKACGREFEREQSIREKPVRKCPHCGKLQAKRLISKTSFVLKGGGWYNDLYASKKPAAKKDAAAKKGDAKNGAGKKDAGAKPEGAAKKTAAAKPAAKKSGGGKAA